jgi:hypothetical protein
MPLYLFFPVSDATSIVIPIVVKGFIEMIVMGILVGLINRNPGFRSYKASV